MGGTPFVRTRTGQRRRADTRSEDALRLSALNGTFDALETVYEDNNVLGALSRLRHARNAGQQMLNVTEDTSVSDWFSLAESGAVISEFGASSAGFSNLAHYLGGAGVLFGMVSKAFELLNAGRSAMESETAVIKAIAASHAYGYWQFDHCQRLRRPKDPPPALESHWHHLDQRVQSILESTGRDASGGRNKQIRMREWKSTVYRTTRALDAEYANTSLALIYNDLERRLPASNVRNRSDHECRTLLKMIACQDYERYPSNAAYLYHISLAGNLESNVRRSFIALYPRYRYDPAIRC